MSDPLICAFCPTMNRPELLGRAIRCFLNQTYTNKFLVILDDLGQYNNQRGDKWELVSIPRRFMSLGEKGNAVAALAPRETYGLLKYDDDDWYYPWHFEAMAEALSRGSWVQPRHAIDFVNGRWVISETWNTKHARKYAYHGQWGIRRSFFKMLGGYRAMYAGDDGELQERIHSDYYNQGGWPSEDIDRTKYKPSYAYNRPLANRISEKGGSEQAYWNCAPKNPTWIGNLTIPEYVDYPEIPTEIVERGW